MLACNISKLNEVTEKIYITLNIRDISKLSNAINA